MCLCLRYISVLNGVISWSVIVVFPGYTHLFLYSQSGKMDKIKHFVSRILSPISISVVQEMSFIKVYSNNQ